MKKAVEITLPILLLEKRAGVFQIALAQEGLSLTLTFGSSGTKRPLPSSLNLLIEQHISTLPPHPLRGSRVQQHSVLTIP